MADSIWWTKMLHKDFCAHYCEMSDSEIVADVRRSVASLMLQRSEGHDFGALMVRMAMERIEAKHETAVANGQQGGRPKKSPHDAPNGNAGVDISDTRNGAASKSPTSCDTFTADGDTREHSRGRYAPPSCSPDDGNPAETAPSHGGSVASLEARQVQARESRRAGGNSLRVAKVSTSPARSSGPMPEDKQAVYDFAAAEGLDTADAYECWQVTVNERDGLTADGKPITNWKAYVRKWCTTRKNNRRTA